MHYHSNVSAMVTYGGERVKLNYTSVYFIFYKYLLVHVKFSGLSTGANAIEMHVLVVLIDVSTNCNCNYIMFV